MNCSDKACVRVFGVGACVGVLGVEACVCVLGVGSGAWGVGCDG